MSMEGWQSGLLRCIDTALNLKGFQEFESPPLF